NSTPTATEPPSGNGGQNGGQTPLSTNEEPFAQWSRAYRQDGDRLSLHGLPQGKTQNADAIVLLIHGYHELLKRESIPSTELMNAAKQSGLRIDRIDRSIPSSHNAYLIKGGNGKGSRYSLNNRGRAYAQELLDQMFE